MALRRVTEEQSAPVTVGHHMKKLIHAIIGDRTAVEDGFLLPYQRRWFYDRSPVKVAIASFRTGMLWTTAAEAVEVASVDSESGGMDVYLMTDKDGVREFLDATVASAHMFDRYEGVVVYEHRVEFPSGHAITVTRPRPSAMRGKRRGYAILANAGMFNIDEWLAASGSLLMWGGRLAILGNYARDPMGRLRALVDGPEDGARAKSLHMVDIHRAIGDGLYERMLRAGETSDPDPLTWLGELREQHDDFEQAFECKPLPIRSPDPWCALIWQDNAQFIAVASALWPDMVSSALEDNDADANERLQDRFAGWNAPATLRGQ